MAQVQDIVRDALGHLGVIDANNPVNAIDMRDSIRALNLMMRRWEANGMAMGWSDVANATDPLPVPPEAEQAIGYNLALRLRSRYRTALDADVIGMAAAGLSELRRDRMVEMPLRHERSPLWPDCYDITTDDCY